MQLPFFYILQFQPGQTEIRLNEEHSRHAVQVLRMKEQDGLHLTDGRGYLINGAIAQAHKKHCVVRVTGCRFFEPVRPQITIAVSLLKNSGRFEWFLEKATEMGVNSIVPLRCARTEKQQLRAERFRNIIISAMLQSRQVWMPRWCAPLELEAFIHEMEDQKNTKKFIAHCAGGEKKRLEPQICDTVVLIGPEGDFSNWEIEKAVTAGYEPVSLGNTRLRTETAAMVAAARMVQAR